MSRDVWEVRLSAAAEADFAAILSWTASEFGIVQARRYAETLRLAIGALSDGPEIVGARKRDDIRNGLKALHVAREGRNGRHFILFRVTGEEHAGIIEIIRILHDAMDLVRHVRPPATE